MWSRSDKIALLGLIIAIVSCLAAIIVVPEIRHWLGLQISEATENRESKIGEDKSKDANSNSLGHAGEETNKEGKASTTPAVNVEENDPNKIAGIAISGLSDRPKVYAEIIQEKTEYMYRAFRVQLLDMAFYRNKKLYVKISVCNAGNNQEKLDELYIWYTPAGGRESINWHFDRIKEEGGFFSGPTYRPLLQLKGGECRDLGAWSTDVSDTFQLSRPLGKLYVSKHGSYPDKFIDLAKEDSFGFIKF
jgi:hypothetical protein